MEAGSENRELDVNLLDTQREDKASPTVREPLRFCKLVANRPHLSFGVVLGVHVLSIVVSVILMISGYDLFPVDFTTLPLNLRHSTWYKRDLAWHGRDEYNDRISREIPADKDKGWPRGERAQKNVLLMYDAGNDNVFTKENLKIMQKIEDSLANIEQYKDYCQVTRDGTCTPVVSVLRLFDGSLSFFNPVFNDPEFNNINKVLYTAYTSNLTKTIFTFALGKTHIINASYVHVTRSRSMIPFGYPLEGQDYTGTVNADVKFISKYFQPLLDEYLDTKELTFLYYCEPLMIEDAMRQGYKDMKLAIGSMIFIFVFILFHTRSLWITCLGVFSILCSFVETNFIYRVVIGYRYFGFFHVLVMFIILGIGADDLFVFWDAWKASELCHFPTLAHRLDETYRKSTISMFVTSLTTMLAFLVSAISPLLATNSFGVFSAMLVVIDYISVITFFPTIVIMYHLHFENKKFLCFGQKQGTGKARSNFTHTNLNGSNRHDSEDHEPLLNDIDEENMTYDDSDTSLLQLNSRQTESSPSLLQPGLQGTGPDCALLRIGSEITESPSSPSVADTDTTAQPEHRWLVVFFRDYYLAVVTHRVCRWVVLAVLLGVIAVFAVSASHMQPDNQQIGLFKESHHHSRGFRLAFHGYMDNGIDLSITLSFGWGVKERDLSSCHFSDYHCRGTEVFDDSFDPSSEAAQEGLLRLCNAIYNMTDQQMDTLKIRRDVISKEPLVSCFIKPLDTFLKTDPLTSQLNASLPWSHATAERVQSSLGSHYNLSRLNSSYSHYFDLAVNYWFWDGFRQNNTQALRDFNGLLGEEITPFSFLTPSPLGVMVGNKLKYLGFKVKMSLHYETLFYVDHIPVVNAWEAFMENQLSTMPPGMKGGFQIATVAWHLLYIQKALVDNAVMGIIVGLSLTLPILILATCNVINGLLATLTIACITVCVIGVVPMAGWKLGVLVSLNMCLVVGLAVDYVVHLAEGYHMSSARDRKTRLKHALERMGISVFSGACTTLGASAFMLFAQIQFFYQFGIFMFCTIGFSLLFSMVLYVTTMGIVGPEGDTGDIRVLLRRCLARLGCCGKSGSADFSGRSNGGALLLMSDNEGDDDLLS